MRYVYWINVTTIGSSQFFEELLYWRCWIVVIHTAGTATTTGYYPSWSKCMITSATAHQ